MRIYFYVAVAAFILTGLVIFAKSQQEIGAINERAKLEKENAEFRVKSAGGAVDYDVCDRARGVFNFKTRRCKLP